jgi:hypothetical protein
LGGCNREQQPGLNQRRCGQATRASQRAGAVATRTLATFTKIREQGCAQQFRTYCPRREYLKTQHLTTQHLNTKPIAIRCPKTHALFEEQSTSETCAKNPRERLEGGLPRDEVGTFTN